MTKKINNVYAKDDTNNYTPDIRNYMEPAPSVKGLPNPAVDPIVCNNIANQEFDYTYDGESMNEYEDLNSNQNMDTKKHIQPESKKQNKKHK